MVFTLQIWGGRSYIPIMHTVQLGHICSKIQWYAEYNSVKLGVQFRCSRITAMGCLNYSLVVPELKPCVV